MKNILILSVSLAAVASFGEPVSNPVIEMFPREIRLYNGFEEGINPAVGITTISDSYNRYHRSRRGFLGQCLDVGVLNFPQTSAKPLIDTTKPGTILIWVKLLREQQPITRGLAQWENGASVFEAMGANNHRMLVMKSVDTQWGSGQFWIFYEGYDSTGTHFSMNAATRCTFTDLKPGEWRLVAAAWTAEKLFISVNGQAYSSAPYDHKMQPLTGGCYLKTTEWKSAETQPGLFAIDECAILSRKLSEDELAEVYADMLLARRTARKGFIFQLAKGRSRSGENFESNLEER